MKKVEKTVFISYRRTNIGYALAIFQALTAQGFDVFFDYNSIDSGDFGSIILNNIESRAHFVVLLTPSALERLNEPSDWLRREIEHAIELKRNIVPLTMEDFNWSSANEHLTGKLSVLSSYNALQVPADYFMEAMERLCTRHLNIELDAVIHPRNPDAQHAADKAKKQAKAQPEVQEKELTAQEWFERGLATNDQKEKVDYYSKAIALKADFAEAYYNRGLAFQVQGDLTGAIEDYNQVITLKAYFAEAYNNRGSAREAQGDLTGAIEDYNQAIALKADYAEAYYNRGVVYWKQSEWEKCVAEWEKTLEINPDDKDAKEWLPNARAKLK